MKKAIGPSLAAAIILAGCASGNTNQVPGIRPGDYAAILPYESSDTRGKHVGLISDIDVRTQMESGLMDLSKEFFSPSEMGYRTHVFLDYDELDATDGSRGLLGRLRDSNPNGLNPSSDEAFDTGNGIAEGPLLLVDIYELDFYRNNSLSGISLGLVVTDSVTINGERVEITPERMKAYVEFVANKLVNYMRERFNGVSASVPILVAAYQLNTDQADSSNGGYIYEGFFQGSDSNFKGIEQKYYVVPSTNFAEADPQMAQEFTQFKNDVSTVLADNTYTTGEARIQNGTTDQMTITVTTHGKSTGEILAVIQSIKEKMSVFTSTDCEYKIIVKNNNEICALMERASGSKSMEIVTIL